MATEIEKLKHYMTPFYQSSEESSVLDWYITEYEYADVAASMLWASIPFTYDVQRFRTGAEETVYASIKDIAELCKERATFYADMAKQRDSNTSVIALISYPALINGATK